MKKCQIVQNPIVNTCVCVNHAVSTKNCVDPVGGPYPWSLVPTLNLGPFEVRVFWDTGASKTIGGIHEEEAIFRGANHVRIGAGIDRRDDRGDLAKAGGVAANFLSLEEKVWRDGIDGDTQTQAT